MDCNAFRWPAWNFLPGDGVYAFEERGFLLV
jgi:hypothetical protein